MSEIKSNYRGSKKTYEMVKEQIRQRFGEAEAEAFDPYQNCLLFRQWNERGFRVKKGQKALKSITVVEDKDEAGNIVRSWPKNISLFYKTQVEKISNS
jgi:hypothetical protein